MKMMNKTKYTGLEIAIVGMSGRFPGAKNITEYWENIKGAKESLRHFSEDELRANGVSDQMISSPDYVKSTCIADDKDFFDSNFFNYTPDEAALMDPQTRILHECVWEALEDAGCVNKLKNYPVGLFAGASGNFDWHVHAMMNQNLNKVDFFRASQLSDAHFMSTLVSYKLDLKGPAIYVNTACSTSLVAVHMACRSLLTGDAKIAIAAGVAMNSEKAQGYMYKPEGILSADGRCRAFNTNSTGTMIGQGAAVVVLKKLQDAIKDGDRIYSVIKGSAINNDGSRKVGYTAPSVDGQVECIRIAHKMAKVEPESIGSIEAHGTGTKLGDPIEALALQKVFNNGKRFSAAIGSAKSNIGHLDAAAGTSGLIRAVLSLWNKQLPPVPHSSDPIPELSWGTDGFYLNPVLKKWERKDNEPLRAGVSSFGIGGTNAHIVLEEAPELEFVSEDEEHKLLIFSARTEKSLQRYQSELLKYVEKQTEISLSDLCYTLKTGRKHFTYRKALSFKNREALIKVLSADFPPVKSKERTNAAVFMFSGAGSQYANMGKELYQQEAVFRHEMDRGFTLLTEMTGMEYSKILYPESKNDNRINEMLHTQPMIFLFGYSLAKLIMSKGIQPQFMIGHSIGEYAAACISGTFSFEDALRLVVKRGELMNTMKAGAMLSVSIKEEQARKYLNHKLTIAAVNAPEQIVFSGEVDSINELMNTLDADEISHVKLFASHAGHSLMIDDIMDRYEAELNKVIFHAPQIPFISNLTGQEIKQEEAMSVTYWLQHMRQTVRFSEGIMALLNQPSEKIFIELGGGHSLCSLLRQQQTGGLNPIALNLVRHPKETEDDMTYLNNRIGELWCNGIDLDWELNYKDKRRMKISLPTYSFEKMKYIAEVNIYENRMTFGNMQTKGFGELKDWIYFPVWKSAVINETPIEGARSYVLFSSEDEFSDVLKAAFVNNGDVVIEVISGKSYKKESKNKYVINPSIAADYISLFADLEKENILSTDIIHLWSIGVDPLAIEWKSENENLHRIYFSLASIANGLQHVGQLSNKRIAVITDSQYTVVGNEQARYSSSILSGILNALSQEYLVSTYNIDINSLEPFKNTGSCVANEIMYNSGDRIIALRNGKRWLRDYQPNTAQLLKRSVVEEGGTILVTGGLGNIGKILSAHLIKNYNSRIAIVGRREMDTELHLKLSALNKNGEHAFYYTSDITNFESLKKTVSKIEETHGNITGIIHSAGITNLDHFELLEEISTEKTLELFAPKIQGIENIYNLFKDKDPSFVWIASSLLSVLGGVGSASFAAANAYMDHFIASKENELINWKCLNLPEIAFTEEDQRQEINSGRFALMPAELCELFDWSVGLSGQSQIIITVKNLYERLREMYDPAEEFNQENDVTEREKMERPNLKNAYVAPVTETEKKLIAMVESFFGMSMIGIDDNFFELGGDSLKAMVLLKRIKKELGVNLTVKDFFKRPAIRMLASEIDELTSLLVKKERTSKIVI